VALVDQATREDAADVMEAVREYGHEVFFHQTDVSSADEVESMAGAVLAKFGQVDVLVNCAGILPNDESRTCPSRTGIEYSTSTSVGRSSARDSFSIKMLERGWGRIINIASQLGQIGGVEAAHYSASKAGVIGFTSHPLERSGRGRTRERHRTRPIDNADVGGRDPSSGARGNSKSYRLAASAP